MTAEREDEVVALLRRCAPRDAPDQETRERMKARLLAVLSAVPPPAAVPAARADG
ncbi:hypothetical protein [Allokutzneria sp. NRRL B-24872]|uniref:hypothetical protein n=1 Tax=Allokutzneria sp. NRRL B-24872 TaxID=1137961 RepID=UPI00143CF02B|nr:hypothetical protein [Allokutzneria sp. NRRL B-24872]